ncbi:MAG: ribonuclease J, partial [Pseudomonadota bacterium]
AAMQDAIGGAVLALMCDSTNVFEPGTSQSEAHVRENLQAQFAPITGRLAVGCFASNVARVQSILQSAKAVGRKVCMLGKSFQRIWNVSQKSGYLQGLDDILVTSDEAEKIPRDQILYLCTGSQGEPRAVLRRLSENALPYARLEAGDSVLFSARIIPGNEEKVAMVQNAFVRNGITVIQDHDYTIHASGHPNSDELVRMISLVKPHIVVPVHGEARHIAAHAKLAKSLQVPHVMEPQNGSIYSLHAQGPRMIDEVAWGYLLLDVKQVINVEHNSIRERRKLSYNGICFISAALGDHGIIGRAQIHLQGLSLFEDENRLYKIIYDIVQKHYDDDLGDLQEMLRVQARRTIRNITGHNPSVVVTLHHVVKG